MKRLYILMAALLALALFTIPAMAADNDSCDVEVVISTVRYLTFDDASVSVTLDEASELDLTFIEFDNDGVIAWGTNVDADTIKVKYTDSDSDWSADWTLYVRKPDGNYMTVGTGDATYYDPGTGEDSYTNADFKIAEADNFWDEGVGTFEATVVFTIS